MGGQAPKKDRSARRSEPGEKDGGLGSTMPEPSNQPEGDGEGPRDKAGMAMHLEPVVPDRSLGRSLHDQAGGEQEA